MSCSEVKLMTSDKLLKLQFVTWNVATKYPEQDLSYLLGLSHLNSCKQLADIYIIGLQEVKSQPQNIIVDIFSEDPWTKSFREALKHLDYVKLRTQRLQGLILNIFCLRKHLIHLRSVDTQYTKTGFGGMWGNKGAVSIRFNIYGINICLVNAHLTPHDHLLADRIAEYNTIIREHSYNVPETTNILYHDYVFWIGDLNFRLAEGLTAQDIDALVKSNNLDVLLEKDQLKITMENLEAFAELTEEKITFPPTYKYEFASQDYDFKRRPSWTDRILYKVNKDAYEDVKLNAVQHNYISHPSYVQSDHKPVSAEFDIVIRPAIPDGYTSIEFHPISVWYTDHRNCASYSFRGNGKSCNTDWIGLYYEGFSSLDEYLVYEYITEENIESISRTRANIYFGETAIRSPGIYVLVYIVQRGNIMGILGMSAPFPGRRKDSKDFSDLKSNSSNNQAYSCR